MKYNNIAERKGGKFLLREFIKKEYIQFDVDAVDFIDAIRIATRPLLEDGAITQEYIEEIIHIYKSTGPYIVITKNIAMPHAPSSTGALRLALGFTRLKIPVISGNENNDPVLMLFSLSAPDSDSHLEMLSHLVEVLSDDRAIQLLLDTHDSNQVIQILN